MPTKKQRRRRAKEHRHEYELVVLDEEGREVELDPNELRAQKEKQRLARASREGKPVDVRDHKGRKIRAPHPPSWKRAIQRGAIFMVFLLVATTFLNKHGNIASQVALAVAYGVISVPMLYFLDRLAHNRYLRATGRETEIKRRR